MRVSDFDFDLPPELVAQTARRRGQSRLLTLDRDRQSWHEGSIADVPRLLNAGDLLVVNDTRVFPARLLGVRDPSGGGVECLLLERARPEDVSDRGPTDNIWSALVHPGQKLKVGAAVIFEDAIRAPGVVIRGQILARRFGGRRLVRLEVAGAPTVDAAVDQLGHVPLPPYIHRSDTAADADRYQTIYARTRGSVAAPTAGLHFDAGLLSALEAAGIQRTTVTLHVGYGTFKPVRAEQVEDHIVDPEPYEIPVSTAEAIAATHQAGHRVIAVGTTTTRALESAAFGDHRISPGPGVASLFLHPSDEPAAPPFRVVDALLTNFHLPRSSLLMLVCAFAGREFVLRAYRDAIARGFHFYSYGDAMLIR